MKDISCEILVIGSGPGGATTAYLLAKAGMDVVLVDEGPLVDQQTTRPYSLSEMSAKYRRGGMTVGFGVPKITYLEGCCVGGASEINAGLYHYPSPEILEQWRRDFEIADFGIQELVPFFKECEQDISVNVMPNGVGPASRKILQGAQRLNWHAGEVPRCWKYSADGKSSRQSMSETMVPKAVKSGCRLLPGVKVRKIFLRGKTASGVLAETVDEHGRSEVFRISFKNILICGGAIQTPALLQRSGIRSNIGNSLRMHPAIRVVAEFDEPINDENEGVPVVQVQEFKPALTLGGSYSGLPHLALWLAGRDDAKVKLARWKNLGIFYALIMAEGKGTVRPLPFWDEPLVRLPLNSGDLIAFGEGLNRLGQLLFAAGAREIDVPVRGFPTAKKEADLQGLRCGIPAATTEISTIHLFSSCPMGENKNLCAVDSFGRLHGFENIYLNDASILPTAPGVNPQALIMAIARRNVLRFLKI